MFGLSVALSTPFLNDGAVDKALLKSHAKWVLENGANSITLFGTTGEGTSICQIEKHEVVDALIKAGLKPDQLIAAVMTSSIEEAISQCRQYYKLGIERILLAPPFFFKDLCFDGILNWYVAVFTSISSLKMQFILYNIPQLTGIAIEPKLIERLKKRFSPEVIFGVKDSSGSLDSTKEFLKDRELMVAVGDERTLADAVNYGAAGAICGLSNIFPDALAEIITRKKHNEMINRMTNLIVKAPVTASVKALLAEKNENDGWLNVRPPLMKSSREHRLLLRNAL
ncbi:MAG: dihydrodipicolinate synthase family protein [Aestuariivita sp.]|nr:dihydrodipicolinate synthase family protein [Aestuariivita sp.]